MVEPSSIYNSSVIAQQNYHLNTEEIYPIKSSSTSSEIKLELEVDEYILSGDIPIHEDCTHNSNNVASFDSDEELSSTLVTQYSTASLNECPSDLSSLKSPITTSFSNDGENNQPSSYSQMTDNKTDFESVEIKPTILEYQEVEAGCSVASGLSSYIEDFNSTMSTCAIIDNQAPKSQPVLSLNKEGLTAVVTKENTTIPDNVTELEGERSHVCKTCGKGFNQQSKLKRHMVLHTWKKQFLCQQCGKVFLNSQRLKVHNYVHTGERQYKCYYCKQRFTGEKSLKKHIAKHAGEHPFMCIHCGKCFKDYKSLDRHLATHTGKKLFECSQCSKSFSLRKRLIKHLRIHTGKHHYQCGLCEKTYCRQDHYHTHLRTCHNTTAN